MKASFSQLLVDLTHWFGESARILPWRSAPTPYRVWISEIMLQQTVVSAVISYFNRFMEKFPTVEKLALASVDEVLTLWSGLGYYSRARNLHRTAQIIAREGFPENRKGWESLPGVGPYTAGAILSIAYHQNEAILDGNIERVWARFRCVARHANYKEQLWRYSWLAVEEGGKKGIDPSHLNQALMELGALICRPSNPDCHRCPLASRCLALKRNEVNQFPQKRKREPMTELEETVFVYELPDGKLYLPPADATSQRWRKGLRDFPTEKNDQWTQQSIYKGFVDTTHVVTHHKIYRRAHVYRLVEPPTSLEDFFSQCENFPYSAACLKTFKNVQERTILDNLNPQDYDEKRGRQ